MYNVPNGIPHHPMASGSSSFSSFLKSFSSSSSLVVLRPTVVLNQGITSAKACFVVNVGDGPVNKIVHFQKHFYNNDRCESLKINKRKVVSEVRDAF